MTITLNGTTGITTPDVTSTADIDVNGVTIGRGAGAVATNTAVGASALASNTSGNLNVAAGVNALYSNTEGSANVASGVSSMYNNTTGSFNTAYGRDALAANTTASNNTAVGYQAGYSQTVADYNTFIGYKAGLSTTGDQNTFLGKFAGNAVTTGTLNTIIGAYNGNQGGLNISTSNNNIVLSDGGGNPRFFISGEPYVYAPPIYAGTTSAAANVHILSNGAMLRSTSSLRYKNTVEDATHGLTELLSLRPVTYKGNNDGDTIFGGLIAEEVHDAGLTEFVQYNEDGEPDALHYGNMVSLCVKAIQELKAELNTVKAELATLKGNP